jgi:hypothetical protein
MGQFQSKEYDGDPYIELMRAVPERELIWWIQKVVWVSMCTRCSSLQGPVGCSSTGCTTLYLVSEQGPHQALLHAAAVLQQ